MALKNFEMFEEVVHNFGLTVTLFSEKTLISTRCITWIHAQLDQQIRDGI